MTVPPESWAHRIWRPLLMCLGVVAAIAFIVLTVEVTLILLRGLTRWSNGLPIDLGGLAGVITAIAGFMGAVIAIVNPIFIARHRERYAQIQGGQVVGPFGPSGAAEAPRPGDSP